MTAATAATLAPSPPALAHPTLPRWLLLPALAVLLALLGACTSLPLGLRGPPSTALPPQDDSPLVRAAQASSPDPALSGFRLLPLGSYSLDARLQLIERARHSLDLQYYVLDNDATGRLLLGRLADAAARGVRVRLLVDDLYTTHSEPLLSALAALPGVQVRLFNPFMVARGSGLAGRFAANLLQARRLNHRMHNKLLVADGAMAVAGGRNIADDYFQRGTQHNFVDLDALIVGPVVTDLSASFDRYWNSPVVLPIEAVTSGRPPAAEQQAAFHAATTEARNTALALPAADALGYGPIGDELQAGRMGLIWGRALALDDPPDKMVRDADQAWADSLAYQALM